ncbi:hypothetical protein AHMF7605_06475 [Adhaeribacter arboris]|uniref:Uncharacterized protein n=1 Tax=Adhaeribacter arboris TaxID=2072846 RepID=A0A2T2YCM9_9BACT|nr:hypothetical protein AHMF7605_06475 [Adhaeribacter arboris]
MNRFVEYKYNPVFIQEKAAGKSYSMSLMKAIGLCNRLRKLRQKESIFDLLALLPGRLYF